MTGERWRQVKSVLDRVLDLPPGERAAFLDQACGGDDGLRREVEVLLRHEEDPEFLAAPAFDLHAVGGRRDDGDAGDAGGRRVGAYRLLRELGRGGMGTVYLAERADGFEQRVAVKLLKRGMDTDEIVRRFEAERQILAELDHPHVARLTDGGTTGDGLPYFVMEHVEGLPVDRYCERHGLPVRRRLELFQKVCAAVHFAHQHLVVHRDLKPANILVTADGTPKLLDFGIAKLLRPEGRTPAGRPPEGRFAATMTAYGSSPMTPLYASPEQLRGRPITTASDVYSLGVVLYELLSGELPYRFEGLLDDQVARRVCEEDPPRPSAAAGRRGGGERRRRQLAGDLDTIVMTAMHKDPKHRFRSAQQLADDLGRHLAGLPVHSRPDTFAYRAGKFVRRHAWGVAASASIAVLVLGFAVTTALQSRQIARASEQISAERDRAEESRDRAAESMEFLLEVFSVVDPNRSQGRDLTARQALDEAALRVPEGFAGQPENRARVMGTIGVIYWNLGLYDQALPLLEESLELRRRHWGDEHVLVAESLHNLANAVRDLGDGERAEALMLRALAIQRREYPGGHPELARGLNNLASLLRQKRDLPAAEARVREALAMKRRLLGEEHSDVATSLHLLASVLVGRGEHGEAEELYRRALAMRRKLDGPVDPGLASTLHNLAKLYARQGRGADALPLAREALSMRRELYGDDHPRLVNSLDTLARALLAAGEAAAARQPLERALEIHRQAGVGARRLALLDKTRAAMLLALGEAAACDEASASARAVLEQRADPRDEVEVAEAESVRGGCLAAGGRWVEAEALLRSGYEALAGSTRATAHQRRQARERLAAAYQARGRPEEAARIRAGR